MKKTDSNRLPPLQPLLFWQTGIFALVAGVVGVRYPIFCLTALALIFWVDSRTWKPAGMLFMLAGAACGVGIGLAYDPVVSSSQKTTPAWVEESIALRKPVRISGTVVSVQGLPEHRLRIILEKVAPLDAATPEPLPGRLVWTWQQPSFRPLPDQSIFATLSVRPVRGFHNSDTSSSEAYWNSKGVFFQAWSKKDQAEPRLSGEPSQSARLREDLRQALLKHLPASAPVEKSVSDAGIAPPTRQPSIPSGWTLIPALLFGDRFYLTQSVVERFQESGLAHSLALSGQHLAIAGIVAWIFITGLGRIAPTIFLRVPSLYLLGAFSIPPACIYLWLGDAPPSLQRAAFMLIIGVFCFWRGWLRMRVTTLFDILMAALGCMVIVDPLSLYDIGVQLSFAAVAGIALAAPLLRQVWLATSFHVHPIELLRSTTSPWLRLRAAYGRFIRFVWLLFGTSLAAQLATLPLTLHAFGYTTFWFPLNLIWLPVLGFLVLPAAFLGLCFAGLAPLLPPLSDTLSSLCLSVAVLPCTFLLASLEWLHRKAHMAVSFGLRPHWTGILGFGALLVAGAMLVGRKRLPPSTKRLFAAGILLLLIGPGLRLVDALSSRISLHVLDVGQGQAVLLEWPPTAKALPSETTKASFLHAALWDRQLSPSFLFQAHGLSRERGMIDGGGFFSNTFDSGRDILRPILTANRSPDLAFIAITHPDRDHLRGLLFLAQHFSPDSAYTAPFSTSSSTKTPPLIFDFPNILDQQRIPRIVLCAGDQLALTENLNLQVMAPAPGVIPSGNNGLIFRLEHHGHGLALLPGDAETPYLKKELLANSDAPLNAEVLLLPHHGSASSLLSAFYDAVQPALAIASAGAYNPYRLPADPVRRALAEHNIPLYVTSELGEISVYWDYNHSGGGGGELSRTLKTDLPMHQISQPQGTAQTWD